jgi:hypothetical protein
VVRNKLKENGACCNKTRQGISEKKAQLEFQVQDRKLIVNTSLEHAKSAAGIRKSESCY